MTTERDPFAHEDYRPVPPSPRRASADHMARYLKLHGLCAKDAADRDEKGQFYEVFASGTWGTARLRLYSVEYVHALIRVNHPAAEAPISRLYASAEEAIVAAMLAIHDGDLAAMDDVPQRVPKSEK